MQLRRFDIMDGCSLNATTLSIGKSVAPPRRCFPEEQFTEPLMLNTSPQPFFTALCHACTPTLRQVSGTLMGLKKKKTRWATCTIGAFCHVFR